LPKHQIHIMAGKHRIFLDAPTSLAASAPTPVRYVQMTRTKTNHFSSPTGEPRRSGRATKGQHTKNQELESPPAAAAAPPPPAPPAPPPPVSKQGKKSKKSKHSEEPSDDEDDSVIRCICGATEDDDGWMMISCEKCTAWQHNLCMGITEDPDKLPEKYFCEQCRPQDHKELLAAMARGEKPWEERIALRKEEERIKSKKGKKGGKARGGRQSGAEPETTPKPALKSATPEQLASPTEQGSKRKFEAVEVTNGHGVRYHFHFAIQN
jgi:PHD-finger